MLRCTPAMAPKGGTLQAQGGLTALEPGRPALEPLGHVLHPFLQPRRQALLSQALPSF